MELQTLSQDELISHFTRFGTFSSIAVLDDSYSLFSIPEIEGCLGYRVILDKAILTGAPLCAPSDAFTLINAFQRFCKDKRWKLVCAAAPSLLAETTHPNLFKSRIESTDEFILNPSIDPTKGSKGRSLRNKINLAAKAGVTIHEWKPGCEISECELEACANRWLNGRRGPQIHLMKAELFSIRKGRRWFYALQQGNVIGVTFIQRAEAHGGWILPMLMPCIRAPKGTSEMLVKEILKILKEEGCHALIVGAVQKERLSSMVGTYIFSRWIIQLLFIISGRIFGLQNRRLFWKKFQPQKTSSYLLFENKRVSYREMYALYKALNTRLF